MMHAFRIWCAVAILGMVAHGVAHAQTLKGTLQTTSFVGPVTGVPVAYTIYLPEGYAASAQRYPVIYMLHGIGGSHVGPFNKSIPASFEAALDACLIGPVIVVFPNGYVDNFWADSFSGLEPAETNMIEELVPHVDAMYRTIPHASNRVVQGFSMGGMGAVKFFAKFPADFVACVEYDGALLTWDELVAFHAPVAQQVFNNDESYFDLYSHWNWTVVNAPILQQGTNIRMVVGALVAGNQRFHDHLIDLAIPHEYVEAGCGHTIPCLLGAQGAASAAFIGERLRPYVEGQTPCATGVGVLTALSGGKGSLDYQWQVEDTGAPGQWLDVSEGMATSVGIATGAAAQQLVLSDLIAGGVARFRCLVGSACGDSTSNAAEVVVRSDADCDGSGDLTIDDFICFQTLFAIGDPSADCDGGGGLTIDDFICFQTMFAVGC